MFLFEICLFFFSLYVFFLLISFFSVFLTVFGPRAISGYALSINSVLPSLFLAAFSKLALLANWLIRLYMVLGGLYGDVHDRVRFFWKNPHPAKMTKNGQKLLKMGFVDFLGKFIHLEIV